VKLALRFILRWQHSKQGEKPCTILSQKSRFRFFLSAPSFQGALCAALFCPSRCCGYWLLSVASPPSPPAKTRRETPPLVALSQKTRIRKAQDITLDINGRRTEDRGLVALHPIHSTKAVRSTKDKNLNFKSVKPGRITSNARMGTRSLALFPLPIRRVGASKCQCRQA
jgi:hypothetical protein